MPYTLLATAALGFDLARRRAGSLVSNIVATGLTADASLLRRLAAAHPGASPAADPAPAPPAQWPPAHWPPAGRAMSAYNTPP